MANANNIKRTQVASLVDELRQDASANKLSQTEQCAILEKLKVFGRTTAGSDAIYAPEGITLLSDIALRPDTPESSREALRCIANAMFLDRRTSQYFTDGGYMERASEAYKSDSADDEFLLGRILFFTTTYAETDGIIRRCVNEHDLAVNAHAAISRHAEAYDKSSSVPVPQMQSMALLETLKLLFTVTSKLFDMKKLFVNTVSPLLTILGSLPVKTPPLQPPTNHIIDALSNIHLDNDIAKAAFFPDKQPTKYVEKIIKILDKAAEIPTNSSLSTGIGKTDEFDDRGASTLKLLHDVYPVAPEGVQEYLRSSLLPSDTERNMPLGAQTSTTLPARLLRLAASPTTTNTRTVLQTLLFTLSDSDPGKFIKNVGYGHASGYLMMRGIPIPPESLEEAARDGEGRRINPITGQYVDDEVAAAEEAARNGQRGLEDMTEEEKEREAERLFVLFERLNKTGVIKVDNPVRTAMQEGRFEELPSDDENDYEGAGGSSSKGKGKT